MSEGAAWLSLLAVVTYAVLDPSVPIVSLIYGLLAGFALFVAVFVFYGMKGWLQDVKERIKSRAPQ